MINPFIYNVAEICSQLNLNHVVLSPGSRCAPLTIAFNRHPEIKIYTISDERSAGYIALGIALKLKHPVGIVCTSGTAAANYLPSVAEAFYQKVPLVIFTADRPPEWIDQQDGQAIRQMSIYSKHVKESYQLPLDLEHSDAKWHFIRIISEAIELSKDFPAGPVHINVPIREPFYPEKDQEIQFSSNLRIRKKSTGIPSISFAGDIKDEFNAASKVLILGGQHPYDAQLTQVLSTLSVNNIPVVGDIISNLHDVEDIIAHPDNFLSHVSHLAEQLRPDLLITFGNSVISKNLKLFFRKFPPRNHWHIQRSGQAADPFQSITRIINADPFTLLSSLEPDNATISVSYKNIWKKLEQSAVTAKKSFFADNTEGEFSVVNLFMASLPSGVNLHLANSMSVRYANFLGVKEKIKNVEIFSNRGTSGIDGCNSTAVGVAFAEPERSNYLITGDMAFLYDRNAFWHNYPIENLKILVLNNFGGGIFRMIDGPAKLPELESLFETRQKSTAVFVAKEFGIRYFEAEDIKDVETKLQKFISYEGAAILEFKSSGLKNHEVFNAFKDRLKQEL